MGMVGEQSRWQRNDSDLHELSDLHFHPSPRWRWSTYSVVAENHRFPAGFSRLAITTFSTIRYVLQATVENIGWLVHPPRLMGLGRGLDAWNWPNPARFPNTVSLVRGKGGVHSTKSLHFENLLIMS